MNVETAPEQGMARVVNAIPAMVSVYIWFFEESRIYKVKLSVAEVAI